MKGELIGYNTEGDSGKQEITIALSEPTDIIKVGSGVTIIYGS